MKHPKLLSEKRTVLGKKVKRLRRDGFLPANIYGKGLPSVSIQVKSEEFDAIYKEVGETGLVDVELDGKVHPSLIKNLQMNYQTRTPLHADFFQVNLKEKIKTMIPLSIIGESPAVEGKIGIMLQTLNEVEVEALPEKLPDHIEVNIENLKELNDQISVADLKSDADVTILSDASQVVVKIAELVVEEPEPEVVEETAEGEAASEETPADGDITATEEEKAE